MRRACADTRYRSKADRILREDQQGRPRPPPAMPMPGGRFYFYGGRSGQNPADCGTADLQTAGALGFGEPVRCNLRTASV